MLITLYQRRKLKSLSDQAGSIQICYESLLILGGLVTEIRHIPTCCPCRTPEKVNNICQCMMLDYRCPVEVYHTQLIPFADD